LMGLKTRQLKKSDFPFFYKTTFNQIEKFFQL